MRPTKAFVALSALLAVGACKNLDVPDLNAPSLGDLQSSPTTAGINTAVLGLIVESRGNAGTVSSIFGAYGREGSNLDPSNPQAPANIYINMDQDNSGGVWTTAYRVKKQGDILLTAVDGVAAFSAAQRAGVKGFVKTLQALALLHNLSALDTSGIAIDATANATDPLPAVLARAPAYAAIVALLDAGNADLGNAGTSFAFGLPAGFAAFSTPTAFRTFNRAIRARANVYNSQYAAALTDLGGSFIDPAAALTLGAYWDFSTNPGDAVNPIYDPTTRQRFAHPSFLAQGKLKNNGDKDDRARTKVATLDVAVFGTLPYIRHGFAVSERLTVYNTSTAAIPIIRNEELLLLRAEANWNQGNHATALTDLNAVRAAAGGLPAITLATWNALTAAQQTDSLLYEKRYSLFWEIGTSWIDARHYNRLTFLPVDRVGDRRFMRWSIPRNECNARTPTPAGCSLPAAIP